MGTFVLQRFDPQWKLARAPEKHVLVAEQANAIEQVYAPRPTALSF